MSQPQTARVSAAVSLVSDDVIVNIYRRLLTRQDRTSFALVCKRWLRTVYHARKTCHVWRADVISAVIQHCPQLTYINCSGTVHMEDEHVMAIAERYSATLTHLDLTNNKRLGEKGLRALGKHCRLLRTLVLRNGTYRDAAIMGAAGCASLEVLRLTNCRELTDVGVSCIAARCKGLRELSLHWCAGLTDAAIEVIVLNCPGLESLDLGYTQVGQEALEAVSRAPALRSLVLAGCKNVGDEALQALAGGATALQSLDISGCTLVTNEGIRALAQAALPLRTLLAPLCPEVSDAALPPLALLPGLEVLKLDLDPVSDAGLNGYAQAWAAKTKGEQPWRSPLQDLSIPRCNGVSSEGVLGVLPGWPLLLRLNLTCCKQVQDSVLLCLAQRCRDLRSLHVESCGGITAVGVKALTAGCPKLELLDLTDCQLTEESVLALSSCSQLKTLKLGYCESMSDSALEQISTHCTRIEDLDLYRCVGFGAAGLGHVGRHCVRLKQINLSYCTDGCTDASLDMFCRGATRLRNLEMRGCRSVTSVGLQAMASGCVSLEELDLKKCTGISDPGLVAMAGGCPYLRQVNLSYCPVGDAGIKALAAMNCAVKFNLIHCEGFTAHGLADALLSCGGLRKVKLLPAWKPKLPEESMLELESRGCVFRWMEKPPDAATE